MIYDLQSIADRPSITRPSEIFLMPSHPDRVRRNYADDPGTTDSGDPKLTPPTQNQPVRAAAAADARATRDDKVGSRGTP
jgi:hypothetical protein